MVMNREKREGSDSLCIWMRRGTPRSTGIYQSALKGCCFVLSLRAFPILKVSQTNVLENHFHAKAKTSASLRNFSSTRTVGSELYCL